MANNYIFASSKDWCINEYEKSFGNKENWHLITSKNELNLDTIEGINPKYIFFPHWSWIVPEQITNQYNCVCFHMADVPYGRGGSPLQNLIIRGHKTTKLTALKMVRELDSGPVYRKTDLNLEGSAKEIFQRAAPKVIELVKYIIESEPQPKEQFGKIVTFERRTPEQSEITSSMGTNEIYDLIRMLDAETYPKAFVNIGSHHIEFSEVTKIQNNELSAYVRIVTKE